MSLSEAIAPPSRGTVLRRQLGAMLALELRKTFLRWRAVPVVLVAFSPAVILGLRLLAAHLGDEGAVMPAAAMAANYGALFQILFLRLVVFFVCFTVFTYLVRGDIAERSLHFYLLQPLRREVFLGGKLLAGITAASMVLVASLAVQILLAFADEQATPGGVAYLLDGPGAGHAAAYVLVTLLAVAGYGALFLALGLLVRNPMIPAAAILGWEWLNPFLPQAAKRLSVIHYLQSLCPLPFEGGPFALPAEPVPAPYAVLGVLLLAGALLLLAAARARRLEVLYTGE